MSQEVSFQSYVEILSEGIKAIRKISFKKINVINELISKFQSFLTKEVYGRIKPTNYLLLFLIALGGRNSKLYTPIVMTIQKLFSNNFINADEQLSGAMQFMKEQYKQFLFLPYADYSRKSFQEVYIQTLVALPEKTDAINLLICKNMSLIFRLCQNNLPANLIMTICDFFVDVILQNKSDQYDKILKSTFLEIVRHSIESYKEVSDRRLLENDEQISIKQICERYGTILADQVAIRLNVEQKYKITNYAIIPKRNQQQILNFRLCQIDQVNEKNQKNGKFGWCAVCRKAANFYCRTQRIPVCSYECKQINLFQSQQLERVYYEETKSLSIFSSHVEQLCKIFSKYLSHQDIRRRTGFAQIFIHLSSELKKISVKNLSPVIFNCLQDIFYQCCFNMVMENEAFVACVVVIKKLIPLDIFIPQIEILLHELSKKLVNFITTTHIKQEILKLIKDLIKNETFFQFFMNIDCSKQRRDVVYQIVCSVSQLYIGIPPPEGLQNLPAQDPNIRKLCFEILTMLEKSIKSINQNKLINQEETNKISLMKKQKNQLKSAISRFNKASKPVKIVKKLISQKYLPNDPKKIAQFLHTHLKKLSFVAIGELIGDLDPLAINIRDQYIHQMQFKDHMIDEGIRILLQHFTIPGESQIVDRIIDSFSKQYFKQNEGQQYFVHSDGVYSLSYLLMMLQTNLHNPQVIEKMTIDQFRNLSKNMNGPGSEFPQDFLEKIYASIEKKQLGFHSNRHTIQIINAYQKNDLKKAQQIHLKYLQKHLAKQYENIENEKNIGPKYEKFSIKLLISELYRPIIQAICIKIRETEQKEELLKNIDLIEEMIRFSLTFNLEHLVGLSIKSIWEQITKISSIKKFMLTQKLYNWVRQFTLYIYDQWYIIIHSFSMFYRTKAIKKDNANKNSIVTVINDKCYVYEGYIESVLIKSSKFNLNNLTCLIDALVDCSKQEIIDNQFTFCLEKIGDIYEYNNSRLNQVVPLTWPKLKQYYIELGKHKVEKVALFGTDFLKQLVTKFIKKKDLQFYQKEYLKPFQQIFNSNVPLGVKEYVVGGLSYFINNYFPNIKEGWRIILWILCDSFQEEQDQMVKEKSHQIVKKIYETNFSIIDLDENYVDYVQILGRMAREKDDTYIKSCLQAIKSILIFYESKLNINLDDPEAKQNQKLDMIFWQTMWLPLLSTIYGICGDFRAEVQNESIQLLFLILMKYGKLFKYQFWKMVMQGILRPTFEQITYTSQSKPLRKKELQQWLRNSFSRLFTSINKLILEYINDFKMFLPDILKIYESCITSNSNKILTQLSTEALTELLLNVGDQFEEQNWREYIEFIRVTLKKNQLSQIQSLEVWKKSQEVSEQSTFYQGKILTLNLILIHCLSTIEKFSHKLQQNHFRQFREIFGEINNFCHKFNKNISLRQSLWKNGFFQEMKSLPGLIKQEHESMKGICLVKFKLIEKSQTYIDEYAQYSLKIMESYKKALITSPPKSFSLELQQRQREGVMIQIIILENILVGLESIGLPKLVELGYKQMLFKYMLDICSQRSFCSKCNFCQFCESAAQRELKFTEEIKKWIKKIFDFKNEDK